MSIFKLSVIILVVGSIVGYILNIIDIMGMSEMIIRIIGVFIPFIGAIVGYF